MAHPLEELVRIAPPVWPGRELSVQPGDLTQFTPMGLGIGGPMIMMPWDDLGSALGRGGYYGFQARSGHPFHGAPMTDAGGGTVYFDGDPKQDEITALLSLMEVRGHIKDYAVFLGESNDPQQDLYLVQLRIVSEWALTGMFHASLEGAMEWVKQPMSIIELLWAFIVQQREQWGTGYSHALSGTFGGDGDWAKEKLAFGFMVENSYQSVYRIWSRAWLVTK